MDDILPMANGARQGDRPDLAALVASRLCHDLVSPLGAIGNGLELLTMMLPPSPELALIGDAVQAAQARVRLFRLAFGAASPDQTLRAADLAEALGAVTGSGRITLRTALPAPLPRPLARRLALAALCAETALAWGGDMAVDATSVTAIAPRLRLDEPLWHALEHGTPLPVATAANVHFALLAASGPVTLDRSGAGLTLRL